MSEPLSPGAAAEKPHIRVPHGLRGCAASLRKRASKVQGTEARSRGGRQDLLGEQPSPTPHHMSLQGKKEFQERTGLTRPHEIPCSSRKQAGQAPEKKAFLDPAGTPVLSLPHLVFGMLRKLHPRPALPLFSEPPASGSGPQRPPPFIPTSTGSPSGPRHPVKRSPVIWGGHRDGARIVPMLATIVSQATSCPSKPTLHALGNIHWQEGTQIESLVLKSVMLSGQKQPSVVGPAS